MGGLSQIMKEVGDVLDSFDETLVSRMGRILDRHQGRVFVVGEGRSGLMGKAFAMRLMHLGAAVYVVGETITPSIQPDDLVVAISGSGTTSSVVEKVVKARQLKCFVIGLTTNPASMLAEGSDLVVHVAAATKHRQKDEAKSVQPLGSLFDQAVHLILDAVCLEVANRREETNESAGKRHSNLE